MLPAKEWARLVREYEKSGLTQRVFAAREGVNLHTFVAWLGRQRKAGTLVEKKPVEFHEVALGAARPALLEIHLPDGVVLKGASAGDLANLVRALRGTVRC